MGLRRGTLRLRDPQFITQAVERRAFEALAPIIDW
jgi:hypothetical protein